MRAVPWWTNTIVSVLAGAILAGALIVFTGHYH